MGVRDLKAGTCKCCGAPVVIDMDSVQDDKAWNYECTVCIKVEKCTNGWPVWVNRDEVSKMRVEVQGLEY
jgi:hypothetical protein